MFAEALAAGGLDGYFPLAEQFHTQADPAFCGLGSLVVALNALSIDPGRLWKGPWRWFAEELLDCCVPLAQVRERGVNLDELTCLARCNGAEVDLQRADTASLEAFRSALAGALSGDGVMVASYDRASLGQTGSGHFSPLAGFHRARDLVLVLDVARFKYPPHWLPAEQLWRAMQPLDSVTGRARGWMLLRRRAHGAALGFSLSCAGESWPVLGQQLRMVIAGLGEAPELLALARAIAPLTAYLELRTPAAEAHREALRSARTALCAIGAFPQIVEAVGTERAEAVALLLLASTELLQPAQQAQLAVMAQAAESNPALVGELSNLGAQLAALWTHLAM